MRGRLELVAAVVFCLGQSLAHQGLSSSVDSFQPTEEFQPIQEGQPVPPGLHVRVNLETGVKEAKLIGETDIEEDSTGLVLNAQESVPHVPAQSDRPELLTSNPHIHPDEYAHFDKLLRHLNRENATLLEETLDSLEGYAHEIEFGEKICNNVGAFENLFAHLSHSDSNVRSYAAMVIGSSLQNNPAAQRQIMNGKVVDRLLRRISKEEVQLVLLRLLFALRVSLQIPNSIPSEFVPGNGHEILQDIFQDGPEAIREKIAILLQDVFTHEQVPEKLLNIQHDPAGTENSKGSLQAWQDILARHDQDGNSEVHKAREALSA